MSTPESKAINKKLRIGSNVSVYHLPTYTRYNVTSSPDGTRVFNPSSLSKLCATLAVANTDPTDVQRYGLVESFKFVIAIYLFLDIILISFVSAL